MILAFISLNKQDYKFDLPNDIDPLIRDAYILSLLMETDDVYITFYSIDGELKTFVTLKSPTTLFCDEFTYRSIKLKMQISVKEYDFDNMNISECKYKRIINNFIDITNKDRTSVVFTKKTILNPSRSIIAQLYNLVDIKKLTITQAF